MSISSLASSSSIHHQIIYLLSPDSIITINLHLLHHVTHKKNPNIIFFILIFFPNKTSNLKKPQILTQNTEIKIWFKIPKSWSTQNPDLLEEQPWEARSEPLRKLVLLFSTGLRTKQALLLQWDPGFQITHLDFRVPSIGGSQVPTKKNFKLWPKPTCNKGTQMWKLIQRSRRKL